MSARNNLTSIFSNFHAEMSDYIDTVHQNRAELIPQDDDGSDFMQQVDDIPEEIEEGEDQSGFVNTDMVQD